MSRPDRRPNSAVRDRAANVERGTLRTALLLVATLVTALAHGGHDSSARPPEEASRPARRTQAPVAGALHGDAAPLARLESTDADAAP
jgi:hypothetical protein